MTDALNARRRRVAVLCLTYGEPASNNFREQYEYSLSILRRLTLRVAPIPPFVLPLLAARRGRIRSRMFREMGFNSPLEPITAEQVAGIRRHLETLRPDVAFDVHMVCEFREPYIDEFLERLRQDPPDEIAILPLYLAESDFTTGISRTDLANFHREHRGRHGLPAPCYVGGFGFEPRMADVMAAFVEQWLDANGWDADKCRDAELVLGSHGTLVYPPEGLNSGAKETAYFYGLLRARLRPRFRGVRVAWLNHALGGKWTYPSAEELAEELHGRGIRKVVYFPFGFLGDNNESVNEGEGAFSKFQWDEIAYMPCPNADDRLCGLLAELTLEHLDRPFREEWDRIEQGGRRDLIQGPRPAVAGRPGPLRFASPVLAATGVLFWCTAGSMLLMRGVGMLDGIQDTLTLSLIFFIAVIVGWFKGTRIIGRVALKNLRRLRTVPQPSPLWQFLSVTSWIVVISMMTLGMSLRFAGLPLPLYVTILLSVGLALLIGGLMGALSFREALPRYIVTMKTRPRDIRTMRERWATMWRDPGPSAK